ncbi:MAG: Uma2 family endonuclease [Armatimonadetes bacterium]|nr:Uma2 family endonuclease [Armatimonadota bacterium]
MPVSTTTDDFVSVAPKDLVFPRMTFEEFLEWSDEDTHAEWVDGKVVFLLGASSRHQSLLYFLSRVVADWIEATGDKGAPFFAPFIMRCRVGMPGREPDLVYVCEENLGKIRKNYMEGAADLAVEIVSPESVSRDHIEKFAEYEAGGVGEYWVIDITNDTAEFYIRDTPNAPYFRRAHLTNATDGKRGLYTCDTLGGLQINVDWLFADTLPTLTSIRREWEANAVK